MRFASSCAVLLVAVAVCQALPTSKLSKSLEDADLESSLDESGSEKDRSKKSASFCVEIRPNGEKPGQNAQMVLEPQTLNLVQPGQSTVSLVQSGQSSVSLVQPGQSSLNLLQPGQSTLNLVQPGQSTLNLVQPGSQQQTFSVIPGQQQMGPTLNVVSGPQQVAAQTYSFVPAPQPVPQTASSLILPAQQPVQPVHTLHIMQPAAQPCAQASYNIVQPAPQPAPQQVQVQVPTLNFVQPAPQPAPEPAAEPAPAPPAPQPKPERIIEVIKPEPEHPKPTQVVNIIQPAQPAPEPATETLNVLPMEPACEEQVVVMPKQQVVYMTEAEPRPKPVVLVSEPEPRPMATVVQMPSHQCHHQQHAVVTECNCHPKNVALLRSDSGMGHMHALALKERSMGPLFRTQQRMDQRAMQPLMISGGSPRSPMMLLNRSIRSDEESKKE